MHCSKAQHTKTAPVKPSYTYLHQMTVYLIWSFMQHENERWKTASRQFCKVQICAFLNLCTRVAAAEQNSWNFLHTLIFFMLSELKLLFFLSFSWIFLNRAPEHFDLAYLSQNVYFLVVDKATAPCLGFCKTGNHSITCFLSMLDVPKGWYRVVLLSRKIFSVHLW